MLGHSPSVVTSGLVLALDAGNTKSYPNTGTTWTDLSGNSNTGTLTNGPTFTSYEARTNGVANTTSGWGTLNCTLTPNSAVSPDGTTNATTITSTSTSNSFAYPGTSSSSNTIYTVSIYAKQGTSPFVWVYDQYNIAGAWFNLSTGAVGSVSGSATASIVNAGNGWYRCIFTKDNTGVTAISNRLDIGLSDTAGSYSVTNGRTAYIYGVQREIGSFATSYIPTTSSPVTRSAGPATLVFDGINDYGVMNISTTTVNCGEVWIYLSANVTPETDMSTTTGTQFASFSSVPGGAYSGAYDGFTLGSWTGGANNETIGYFHGANSFRFITDTVFAGWHQIGINWNSSSLSYDIFVDGAIKTTYNAHSFWGNIGQFTTNKVTIGSGTAAASQYFFNGKVAVARLYNVALTSAQILQNFNALRGRFGL